MLHHLILIFILVLVSKFALTKCAVFEHGLLFFTDLCKPGIQIRLRELAAISVEVEAEGLKIGEGRLHGGVLESCELTAFICVHAYSTRFLRLVQGCHHLLDVGGVEDLFQQFLVRKKLGLLL